MARKKRTFQCSVKKNVTKKVVNVTEQLIHTKRILIMHCQEIKKNVSDGRAEFSQITQAQIPENDKHCELWCELYEENGAAGHRIEEIHIIA